MSIVTAGAARVFVGLDYHDSKVQVCVVAESGKILMDKPVSNSKSAIAAAMRRHGEVQEVAIEACSGAANLAEELIAEGFQVSLAHPGFVSRMRQNPDKTDFDDARILGDLVRVGYLPKVWLPPDNIRELRRIVRYRQQLVLQR